MIPHERVARLAGEAACIAALAFVSMLALAFEDGPPAHTTGGFGEDSCVACHFGGNENDAAGSLTVSGFPARYAAGETYVLEISLQRQELAAAGFQLAIRRLQDGRQAGELSVPTGERCRVAVTEERDVQYAHHVLCGSELAEPGSARWTLEWTAPDTAEDVVLHASAVAGDGDASQLGDHVYTREQHAGAAGNSR